MSARFPSLHEGACPLETHGQKAALLSRAASQGERVPAGVVLTAHEAAALAAGSAELAARLAASVAWLAEAGATRLAVRSSPTLSLPGALLTRLDVPCELAAVQAALVEVVASTRAAAAVDQLRARGLVAPEAAWCGAVVQAYVSPAVAAGSAAARVGIVACTHQPTTGERGLFGEYVDRAGADSVVSGRALPPASASPTPQPLSCAAARRGAEDSALERTRPALFAELGQLVERLEQAFEEPLELELAHADGVTWLLQVRPLVLSPRAQARVALAAIEADSPRYRELLRRLLADGLPHLVESRLPPPERAGATVLGRGLAASPGVGSGVLVIDLASALERARSEPVVLARRDAVPEDVAAFRASRGVLTTSGGLTSHAAVIARGLRVPAVVGAERMRVDPRQRCLVDAVDATRVLAREGDPVTLDAHRGLLYAGTLAPEPAVAAPELGQLLVEARKLRRVPVWVRAPLAQALALRSAFVLDGVLAELAPGEVVNRPETPSKDVWVEVDAAAAQELVPRLPPAHGLVLRGPVDDALLRTVRGLSRLLAVGVHARDAAGLREPVDLLVCASGDDVSELAIAAPKIVRLVDSAADFLNAGHESGAILACAPTQALTFALGLAAVGRAGPAWPAPAS